MIANIDDIKFEKKCLRLDLDTFVSIRDFYYTVHKYYYYPFVPTNSKFITFTIWADFTLPNFWGTCPHCYELI